MIGKLRFFAIALFSLLSAACTHDLNYDQSYFTAASPEGASVSGAAAIVTSRADEARVLAAKPASYTGGATTLNVPASRIMKEAAVRNFDAVMSEGARSAVTTEALDYADYRIEPELSTFSYKLDQLSNAGFAITPRVTMSVQIVARDRDDAVLMDELYSREDYGLGTYVASFEPHERINRAIHVVAQELMIEAAEDFAAIIESRERNRDGAEDAVAALNSR